MAIDAFHKLDIILLCGLYGSGKNKFSLDHFKGTGRDRISRSEIRQYMYEMTHFGQKWTSNDFNEDDDFLVKHIERKILEHYLHNKKKVLIINTFVSASSRKKFIDIAVSSKKSIGAIFLNPPLDECIARNRAENSIVPDMIVRSLFNKIELPNKKEGFSEILIVNGNHA